MPEVCLLVLCKYGAINTQHRDSSSCYLVKETLSDEILFFPVPSELILNVLSHLAWNDVVWGRRCSVLREKVRRGLRFALSNPYIHIYTPWPCEPLNLCRLIMSTPGLCITTEEEKNTPACWHKRSISLYCVHSLMVIERQQLAYLLIWSLGLWYCGHLENMRCHYEHLITSYSGLLWFEFSELNHQTG